MPIPRYESLTKVALKIFEGRQAPKIVTPASLLQQARIPNLRAQSSLELKKEVDYREKRV